MFNRKQPPMSASTFGALLGFAAAVWTGGRVARGQWTDDGPDDRPGSVAEPVRRCEAADAPPVTLDGIYSADDLVGTISRVARAR